MKKQLLFAASLMLGFGVSAQFTNDNVPAVGMGQTLYVMDSLAPSFSDVTGDGVVWDYSETAGYDGETRAMTFLDASEAENGSDFPTSSMAVDIESFTTQYMTSDADARKSQGFVLETDIMGQDVVIKATFDGDEVLMEYPFDLGDVAGGDISGNVELGMFGDGDFEGENEATVDGVGTLKIGDQTFENVYRYKLKDNLDATIESMLGDIDANVVRTQYEYYQLGENDNMPLFIHVNLDIENDLQPIEMKMVFSAIEPTDMSASVNDEKFAATAIYPNPATEEINVQLPTDVNEATVSIIDELGRTVYSTSMNSGFETINVGSLAKGTYIVSISDDNNRSTKHIVIQ